MIYIKKGKVPAAFLTYSRQANAHFDDMPAATKQKLREALWQEQGGICAYCMSPIAAEGNSMKIEHFHARTAANELDYHNLLAVCHGGDNREAAHRTCDTSKGNQDLHISPLNQSDMTSIYYNSNGRILTEKEDLQTELEHIINLNDVYLVHNRQNALKSLKRMIYKQCRGKEATRQYWQRIYQKLSSKENGEYRPYVGILLWYLKKKVR